MAENEERKALLDQSTNRATRLRNVLSTFNKSPSQASLARVQSPAGSDGSQTSNATHLGNTQIPPSVRAVMDWEVDDRASLGGISSRSASTAGAPSSASFQPNEVTDNHNSMAEWTSVSTGSHTSPVPDPGNIVQACVFVEDAFHYRSIHHRVDNKSLIIYRIYYSRAIQWSIYLTIAVLHLLAFIEFPSSLTMTTDIRSPTERPHLPCGVTESIEFVCLIVFLADALLKTYLSGQQWRKQFWLMAYFGVVFVSLVDWLVSVSLLCSTTVRIRRMLRPFFLLQNSSLMKKTVKSLRKTMPQVISVLLLLVLHLYFFTLFAMLLFPKPLTSRFRNITESDTSEEHQEYFPSLIDGFINLLVLLTTANNPDVSMPAYNENRFYAMFFIIYLAIGLYCIMNMLTAVIYNQFRGYFTESIQTSLFRRCLAIRAAFEVLRMRKVSMRYSSSFAKNSESVPVDHLKLVLVQAHLKEPYKDAMLVELDKLAVGSVNYSLFQQVFLIINADLSKKPRPPLQLVSNRWLLKLQRICSHQYYNYVACAAAAINVICLTLELHFEFDHIRSSKNTYLGLFNLVFVIYYLLEQSLKCWALGWRRFCWDRGNVFDGLITIILVILELVFIICYGAPFDNSKHPGYMKGITLWDLVRLTNMFILIRLIRLVVSQIKSMFIVASTLLDLMRNLRAFAGLMVVIFYSYGLLGMELFAGKITVQSNMTNSSTDYSQVCGAYEQLEYWANNFDDFAAALVVLWDVMIVNNWHVFLHVYSRFTTSWSQLYFVLWWLLSVVIAVNLFTALLLENFIMRWDKQLRPRRDQVEHVDSDSYQTSYMTVHDMFRDGLQEPSEESLMVELRHHPHFKHIL